MPNPSQYYKLDLRSRRLPLAIGLAGSLALLTGSRALAQDWGYEYSNSQPQTGKVSQPLTTGQKQVGTPKAKGRNTSPQAAAPPVNSAVRTSPEASPAAADTRAGDTSSTPAARRPLTEKQCWLELFAVCASSPVDDDRKDLEKLATLAADQQKELGAFIDKRSDSLAYKTLLPVWKELRPRIFSELDYKDSYRLLFRALLRHALGDAKTSLSASEKEMFQNLLGPARISEMGPPTLTEDAINAYADMTCFLFQKRKPDRSIDGEENRQVFADVIKQRYMQAPDLRAKQAMCNFDLTWACFRCRYLALNENGQARLSKLMAGGDGKGELKAELTNPEMLKIFAMGPWSEKKGTSN